MRWGRQQGDRETAGGGGRLPLALRKPRAMLAVALTAIAVLVVLGQGVEDELRPTSLSVPGTESGKASALVHRYFGDSAPFAILLQGPPDAIDEQGPALVQALRDRPECHDDLALGQRQRRQPAAGARTRR